MSRLSVPLLLATLVACDAKSTFKPPTGAGSPGASGAPAPTAWTEFRVGASAVEFPCKPEQVAPGRTRCTLPDGADFSLAVVGLRRPEPDELRLVKAYVAGLPGAKLLQGDAFPVRWTESRWLHKEEHQLQIAGGGMECLLTVSWATAEPPAAAAEFFTRARIK
jgi:hypothetical protein